MHCAERVKLREYRDVWYRLQRRTIVCLPAKICGLCNKDYWGSTSDWWVTYDRGQSRVTETWHKCRETDNTWYECGTHVMIAAYVGRKAFSTSRYHKEEALVLPPSEVFVDIWVIVFTWQADFDGIKWGRLVNIKSIWHVLRPLEHSVKYGIGLS